MRILSIEVPHFRVLKNVKLDFDSKLTPQIFPIGSTNGRGKSTLLQLVFALLHCSAEEKRQPYLRELLKSFEHPEGMDEKLVAKLKIELESEVYTLSFSSLSPVFLKQYLVDSKTHGFRLAMYCSKKIVGSVI